MKTLANFKSIAMMAILALFMVPSFGQGGPPGGNRPGGGPGGRQYTEEDVKQRVKRQSQELGMNEEQEKKITEFELQQYKKMQVERQKNQGDWEKMRETMRANRELRDAKYKEVLTEEQYKKYQQQQEERMQRMRERREAGGQGGGQRGDRGRGRQ